MPNFLWLCNCRTIYATYISIYIIYLYRHSCTHTRTCNKPHLWWSVARSTNGVVPVELSQNRVACLHFGHLQGRVKVRELHCKLLSMVTDQGGLTTTLSGGEEVARCMNKGESQKTEYTIEHAMFDVVEPRCYVHCCHQVN